MPRGERGGAGGVSVRPLGRHLAISLPSLPLRLWDTHALHSGSPPDGPPKRRLHPRPQHPPPPPPSPPPLPVPQEAPGQKKPPTPVWQAPQPSCPNSATCHWPSRGAAPSNDTRHWSSWSLDRPDAVVTPYDTPPDRCVPVRPSPSRPNYISSSQSSPGHYPSHGAPGQQRQDASEPEEKELSELDSLYQASLKAGRPGSSPSERLLSRIGEQARSQTPSAAMERSAYGIDSGSSPAYLNRPMAARDLRWGAEPGDGEGLQRIGRSLSGTMTSTRRGRLTATRSFELSSGSGSFWLCLTGVKLSSDQSLSFLH
ncbi:uncharacterized protein FYW47_015013 [Aplochiton taeniatus]